MNLSVDKQFSSWESIRTWKLAYEKANMRFCKSNVEVSGSTVDYFMDGVVRYPMLIWMFRPVVMQLMSCLRVVSCQSSACSTGSQLLVDEVQERGGPLHTLKVSRYVKDRSQNCPLTSYV